MNQRNANPRYSITNDLSVVASFLLVGMVFGFFFASVISRSSLQSFFFIKGDKFLIPRYSYWLTFGLLQVLGLGGAYLVCVLRHWMIQPISRMRLLATAVIVGFATPGLRLVTPLLNLRLGLNWDFIGAPIVFLFLVSCALCVFSGNVKLLPIAMVWNLVFLTAGFAFVYVGVQVIGRSVSYEFVQWPVLNAILGLSFGNWLIWTACGVGSRRRTSA